MFIKEGIIASPGISMARAFVYEKVAVQVSDVTCEEVSQELDKLNKALDESRAQLAQIHLKATGELGAEDAAIFEAHGMIVEDPEFVESIKKEISDNCANAAYAVHVVTKQMVSMFEQMNDPYFSARAADVEDVGNRIRNNILGIKAADISKLHEDVIIIANDLAPSDTAMMDKKRVLGFATNAGSRTSHTAIMARSLEIPAVLGLSDIAQQVKTGDMIIVDGLTGRVIVNPYRYQIQALKEDQVKYLAYLKELASLKDKEAVTLDGHQVELVGNIGEPGDVQGVLKNGGSGVGLFRTEFLYMNSDKMPDEEKQMASYRTVLEAFPDGPVIIRTMDIGGDKKIPYLPMDEEMNPFLGLRAIRLCFKEIELFKIQLRAILRASVFGKAYIMFPMISNVEEVRQAKKILAECMKDLDERHLPYQKDIKVGVMIEIPSAALTADIIAKEVDFFSIGTNDLCQYTIAVDRMNQDVSYLYDPFNPAILRLIKQVILATKGNPKLFTGMCGEMAGDPMAVIILLGLGLEEFSMSALSIPKVKKIIRSMRYEDAKKIAEEALLLESGAEVMRHAYESVRKLEIEF